jgi:cytochrome c-type biogenesis protein CcmF
VLGRRLQWPAWAGTAALVLAVVLGARGVVPLVTFGLAGFAAGSAVRQIVLASRRQGWRGLVGRANGGMVVHIGVILVAVAFAASSSYATQRELVLDEGESATIAGHTVTYVGTQTTELPERTKVSARVQVDGGGEYAPALSQYPSFGTPIGTPSVRTTFVDDVYLALLDLPDPGGPARLRVIVLPLVLWLWIGGGVVAIGTALAAWPGRRRRPTDPVSAAVPGPRTERELVEVG